MPSEDLPPGAPPDTALGKAPGTSRLESLFHQALELDPQDRPRFLEHSCGEDIALRQELEELLAADASSEDSWPGLALTTTGPALPSSKPPESLRIPGYKVQRLLGHGGMGAVYLALRQDELFDGKTCAIKVLRHRWASRDGAERFVAERRILSRLEHPFIARLQDGGELDDGTPYLVMDYIEGLPLDRYCTEHRLSVEARLELFCKICSAVHAAHQSLVVHRDLKPSNILVTEDGTPRLLDFGIAKLLEPRVPQTPARPTFDPMTPGYASPEQARGEEVSTADDTYSLGVLLHKLLTGCLPSVAHGTSPRFAMQSDAVIEAAALCGLSPSRLRRRLSGDLDAIVRKALHGEPRQRYGSVRELSEDLERHLAILPVMASRGGWLDRGSKFLRRHRLSLALGISFLLAAVFTTATFVQSRHLSRSREVLRQLAGPPADPLMNQTFLDQAVDQITRLDASPGDKMRLLVVLRSLYMPDQTYGEALEILTGEHGGDDQALARAMLARSLGYLLSEKGLFEHAEPFLRLSLDAAEEAYGADAPALAEHLEELAVDLGQLELYDEASDLLRRSLALRRGGPTPSGPEMAAGLENVGTVLYDRGAYAAAENVLRRALHLAESGSDLERSEILNVLALCLMEQAKHEEAEVRIREAAEIRQRLFGEDHAGHFVSQHNLFVVLSRKAEDLGRLGDLEAALPVGLHVVERVEAALGEHPRLAHTLQRIGTSYLRLGAHEKCEHYARRAVDLRREHMPQHWNTAMSESLLGACLSELGRFAEAGRLLSSSLQILEDRRGPEDRWTRQTVARLERLQELHATESQ